MPCDLTMKKQIRECLPIFHNPLNYIHHEELLYGKSQAKIDALSTENEEADSSMFSHVSHAIELY